MSAGRIDHNASDCLSNAIMADVCLCGMFRGASHGSLWQALCLVLFIGIMFLSKQIFIETLELVKTISICGTNIIIH